MYTIILHGLITPSMLWLKTVWHFKPETQTLSSIQLLSMRGWNNYAAANIKWNASKNIKSPCLWRQKSKQTKLTESPTPREKLYQYNIDLYWSKIYAFKRLKFNVHRTAVLEF